MNHNKRQTVDLLNGSGLTRREKRSVQLWSRAVGKARQALAGLGLACAIVAGAAMASPVVAGLIVTIGLLGFVPTMKAATEANVFGLSTPRILNYVPGIQGVAASSVATVNAQVDRRYHSLRILTTLTGALADPVTVVTLVELVVNGVVMRTGAPATFINIAKTYRYTPGTGELPIFFTEFWRNESPRAAEATSWDLFGQNTFTIRLTFGAGVVGVQSILADFDGKRNVRRNEQGQQEAFLNIVKQFDINFTAAAGTNDCVTIPTNRPIQRIFTAISASSLTSVQIFADNNVKVWEATKVENQYILNANDITATFFEYPIIFDYDARIDGNLKTSYLDVRAVAVGAATLTFTVHQMCPGYV